MNGIFSPPFLSFAIFSLYEIISLVFIAASSLYRRSISKIDHFKTAGARCGSVITGVSKWGIFVELTESKCEGMVSLRLMNDDFYYLDEENYRIIGQRWGKIYRLGDKIRIKVKKIDLQKKQMDFDLVR